MQLEGRRKSSNVEDRRHSSGAMVGGGIGLGGIIIIALYMLFGGNPSDLEGMLGGMEGSAQTGEYVETDQDRELFDFASTILAGTEDVWTDIFKKNGLTYVPPKLVIFNGSVQSGCGGATSQSGPFYCSADQSVYLDLSFFKSMKQQLGADGDFAWAYVIAHEVGHHVQYLLGTLTEVNNQRQRVSEKEANQLTVRLELQADFYAGIWAYHDNKKFKSLQAGDLDEGLNCASKIGDDYLQKKAYGRTVPDSFTHGTSEQRSRWLKKGFTTGNPALGDTFSPRYSDL